MKYLICLCLIGLLTGCQAGQIQTQDFCFDNRGHSDHLCHLNPNINMIIQPFHDKELTASNYYFYNTK